ncbi:MAG: hypothetical protein KKB25_01420 [Nanoarchaeota archaeon]|nr:hypothetical protein [Nanoarchaeota archaeon]
MYIIIRHKFEVMLMGAETVCKDLIKILGNAGLVERLDAETRNEGIKYSDNIIGLLEGLEVERVQGIGDDFIPDTKLYNALGAIYSVLQPESRKRALNAYMQKFDGTNYISVQENHTPFIREPLVLADIDNERHLYWPGLDEGKNIIQMHDNFAELKEEVMDGNGLFKPEAVNSDFCVGYALLRNDMSPFGEEYSESCNPAFLDRVVEAAVSMRIGKAAAMGNIEKGKSRLKELLPSKLHDTIEAKYGFSKPL